MSAKKRTNWKTKIKKEQNYICPVCGRKGTNKTLNIHHKVAKSNNGTSERSNVVAWHKNFHDAYHRVNGNATSDDWGNPV